MVEKNFGKKLKELREHLKWSQEKMAEKIAVERPTISEYETGKSFPSIVTFGYIVTAIKKEIKDFDPDFLLGYSSVMKKQYQPIATTLGLDERSIDNLIRIAEANEEELNDLLSADDLQDLLEVQKKIKDHIKNKQIPEAYEKIKRGKQLSEKEIEKLRKEIFEDQEYRSNNLELSDSLKSVMGNINRNFQKEKIKDYSNMLSFIVSSTGSPKGINGTTGKDLLDYISLYKIFMGEDPDFD